MIGGGKMTGLKVGKADRVEEIEENRVDVVKGRRYWVVRGRGGSRLIEAVFREGSGIGPRSLAVY